MFQTCLSHGLTGIRTLSGVILTHSEPPLCPVAKVSPRVSVKYFMLIFIWLILKPFSWFRAGFGRAGLLPRKMTQLPTFALLIPPLSALSWQHWRRLGTVLCTHNPTSLKLMQSPRKSHLCSFNTGKDQSLTSAQRLSVALDQWLVTACAAAGTGRAKRGRDLLTRSINVDLANSLFRIRPRFCILSESNVLLISEGRGMVHLWWWLKARADKRLPSHG